MHKALLVEDNKEVFQMVQQAIGSVTDLDWVQTIADAEKILSSNNNFHLFLLDIELPDGNGIDLCSKLQYLKPNIPIFFLTSHTDLSEKVLGFSAGAEDFISKPFLPLELKARVEAKLKKMDLVKQSSDILKWKELVIYKNRQEVSVLNGANYQKIELTAIEFKLLLLLANQPFEVISRDQFLSSIWGDDVHVYSRSVDTHISKLKKKLGPAATTIEAVHGVGYKFVPTETNLM
jgi:DNA-binding response OmpR family regulator